MHRWRAGHIIRLSSVCVTRNAANIRGSTMVLGSRARQSTGHGICRREPELVSKDPRTRLHHSCMCDVERRRGTVRGSAHILPPSAGQHTIILSLTIQTEDNHSMLPTFPVISILSLSVQLTHQPCSGSSSLC